MKRNEMTLNQLLDRVEPSKSVELLRKVQELQKTDSEVLNFTGGEPDFPTPEAVCREAYEQMLKGNTHYVNPKGDPELRAALAEKLAKENGAPYPAENILITPGGKYAIYIAVQAIVNPGDEVLWLAPGWVSYPAIITLCGGTPVKVELEHDEAYAITAAQLEAKTTEKTKLLIINYPNNPTGRLLTAEDMRQLKLYLTRHPEVYVISDEIYEKLVYDGQRSLSPAADPELFERVAIVNGFSKCSAMTGWRIGYLACGGRVYDAAAKIFGHAISCTAGFIQKAAVKALHADTETEMMRAAYESRRNLIIEGLREIPKVSCVMPEGAFYLWLKFDTDMDSEALCGRLLSEAKLAGIPGAAYGATRYTMARFCYAAAPEKLREFLRRLKIFCEEKL